MEDHESNKDGIPPIIEPSYKELMRNGDISAINLPDVSMNRMEFEQFQLIENGSNKGKAVLLSNIGFKYTLSRKTTTSYWRCYKQAKPNVCPGTVRQKGEIYLNTWRNSGSGAPRFHLFRGHVTENMCEPTTTAKVGIVASTGKQKHLAQIYINSLICFIEKVFKPP